MKKINLLVIPFLFLWSCAQQSSLSGGAKDTDAPQLELAKTFPANRSTNFSATEIQIGFDEFIKLNNPDKNIIITPSLPFKPIFEVKGKKILIKLTGELAENTTYLINFGNSIADLTEGNRISNYSYVLSTGNEIDSLELKGNVYDAFSKTSEKEILVALYKNNRDSLAMLETPYYFTQTNSKGFFKFKTLKAGDYTLIAIDDKNGNYKFAPNSERIAFLDTMITINSDSINQNQSVTLSLFEEEKKKLFVSSKKYIYPGKVEVILNAKAKNTTITLVDNLFSDGEKQKSYTNKDTIQFWVQHIDSISKIKFIASIDDFAPDTTKVSIKKRKKKRDSTLLFNTNTRNDLPFFEDIMFTFKSPIKKINSETIKLINEDSTAIPFKVEVKENKMAIIAKLKEDVDYELFAVPHSIVDIYNRTIDSTHLFFKIKPQNKYGNLILHYEQKTDIPHIIHLIKNGKVMEEIVVSEKTKTLNFKNLPTGNYTLKSIFDSNRNAYWDTGNYLKNKQPEKVILYEGEIKIKAGWDVDLIWKVL